MPFEKRRLTAKERASLDFTALGVIERRVPPSSWEWGVDLERNILCAQLVSSDNEMREGDYWYLLLVGERPFIFYVDAFQQTRVDGYLRAAFLLDRSPRPMPSELPFLERAASEAHQAVSFRHEPLVFSSAPSL